MVVNVTGTFRGVFGWGSTIHRNLDFFLEKPVQTHMGVSKNDGTPKSSILIGFPIIFTIHFGGFPPIFGHTHIPKKGTQNLDTTPGQPGFNPVNLGSTRLTWVR